MLAAMSWALSQKPKSLLLLTNTLILATITGCQTMTEIRLTSDPFMQTQDETNDVSVTDPLSTKLLSNSEICALIFVEGQNQQRFEMEAIRRNLICEKIIDQNNTEMSNPRYAKPPDPITNGVEEGPPKTPPVTTGSGNSAPNTTVKQSEHKSKEPASGVTINVSPSKSSSKTPAPLSSKQTLCEKVARKDYAAVKQALLSGVQCN